MFRDTIDKVVEAHAKVVVRLSNIEKGLDEDIALLNEEIDKLSARKSAVAAERARAAKIKSNFSTLLDT